MQMPVGGGAAGANLERLTHNLSCSFSDLRCLTLGMIWESLSAPEGCNPTTCPWLPEAAAKEHRTDLCQYPGHPGKVRGQGSGYGWFGLGVWIWVWVGFGLGLGLGLGCGWGWILGVGLV